MSKKVIYILLFIICSFIVLTYLERTYPNVLSSSDSPSVFERFLPTLAKKQRESQFEKLKSEISDRQGTFSIYIKKIRTGEQYLYNQDVYFYTASLYKTPIAAAAFKQVQDSELSLDNQISYLAQDFSDGTGTINTLGVGTVLTLDYVLDRLLKDSDNTAQNMLLRTLDPVEIIAAFNLAAENSTFYNTNDATVIQVGDFYSNLKTTDYLDKEHFEVLIAKMARTSFDDRISLGLNKNITFAHKIGNWGDTGSWHDCGYALKDGETVVVCVLSKNTTYIDFTDVSRLTGEFVNLLF